MATNDYLLKYSIDADTQQAVAKLTGLDKSLGSLESTFSGFGSAATIATAGFAAVGAAATAAGTAIYRLTVAASDFGSEIFDASQKTGLGAEALSALKYAADQSGSSFEQVTKGIVNFGVEVGKSAQGNEAATKKLATLGVTSTDLETALKQVFTTINNGRTDTDKLTLAADAFGKKIGPDLIPLIKDANGNFTGLIQTVKRLNLTITDENAAAADAFGDKLGDLNKQLAGVGYTIGFAVMPQLTSLASEFSLFLSSNQNEVDVWAKSVADSFRWLTTELRRFYNDTRFVMDFLSVLNPFSNKTWDGDFGNALARASRTSAEIDQAAKVGQAKSLYGDVNTDPGYQTTIPGMPKNWQMPSGVPASIPRVTGGGTSRGKAPKYSSGNDIINGVNNGSIFMPPLDGSFPTAEAAASNERDRVSGLERTMNEYLRLFEAQQKKALAIATQYAGEQGKTEADLARYRESLDEGVLQAKREQLVKYMDSVAANDEEYKAAQYDLQLLDLEIETQRAEHATNEQKRKKAALADIKKEHDAQNKSFNDYVRNLAAQTAAQDEAAAKRAQASIEGSTATAPGTYGGGIASGLGVDLVSIFDPNNLGHVKDGAEYMKDIYADVADFAGNAIGSMIDGITQMGAAWLSTGEFSAKAALQMLSAAALNIAGQSLFKGVFELAEAAASAAVGDFRGAALHTAASHFYFTTAAIAGAAGVGLGLGARAAGGGSGGGGGSSSYGGSSGQYSGSTRNHDPYSRSGEMTYQSGNQNHIAALTRAVERLDNKLGGMRPGDVLVRGMGERPGAVAQGVERDIARNSNQGMRIARSMGIK